MWNSNGLRNQIFNPHHTIAERFSRNTTFFHEYLADKNVLRKGRFYFTASNKIINLEYTVDSSIICKRQVFDVSKLKYISVVLIDEHNHADRMY